MYKGIDDYVPGHNSRANPVHANPVHAAPIHVHAAPIHNYSNAVEDDAREICLDFSTDEQSFIFKACYDKTLADLKKQKQEKRGTIAENILDVFAAIGRGVSGKRTEGEDWWKIKPRGDDDPEGKGKKVLVGAAVGIGSIIVLYIGYRALTSGKK